MTRSDSLRGVAFGELFVDPGTVLKAEFERSESRRLFDCNTFLSSHIEKKDKPWATICWVVQTAALKKSRWG